MSNKNLRSRNIISLIKESIKTTLEGSSIHAIPNIVRNKYISLKMLWLLCFLASSAGLGYFLSLTISDFLTYPVITNIEINHVQQLIFPIVTICNLNGFSSLDNQKLINECYFNRGTCSKENDFEAVVVFISNETIDSRVDTGIKLSPGTSTDIKLSIYTIIKQPQPYSNCLNGLISPDSYNSECYKKTIQKSKSGNYHYTDCQNMCLQKLIGDRCSFQTDIVGPIYYEYIKAIFLDILQN